MLCFHTKNDLANRGLGTLNRHWWLEGVFRRLSFPISTLNRQAHTLQLSSGTVAMCTCSRASVITASLKEKPSGALMFIIARTFPGCATANIELERNSLRGVQ